MNFHELYDSARSWPEDYEQENGQYENICCICKERFLGNKHRVVCKECHQEEIQVLKNINKNQSGIMNDWQEEIADLVLENKKLRETYEEYIELLTDEIKDLMSVALVHGWKSSRVEAGEKARANIQALKEENE